MRGLAGWGGSGRGTGRDGDGAGTGGGDGGGDGGQGGGDGDGAGDGDGGQGDGDGDGGRGRDRAGEGCDGSGSPAALHALTTPPGSRPPSPESYELDNTRALTTITATGHDRNRIHVVWSVCTESSVDRFGVRSRLVLLQTTVYKSYVSKSYT